MSGHPLVKQWPVGWLHSRGIGASSVRLLSRQKHAKGGAPVAAGPIVKLGAEETPRGNVPAYLPLDWACVLTDCMGRQVQAPPSEVVKFNVWADPVLGASPLGNARVAGWQRFWQSERRRLGTRRSVVDVELLYQLEQRGAVHLQDLGSLSPVAAGLALRRHNRRPTPGVGGGGLRIFEGQRRRLSVSRIKIR